MESENIPPLNSVDELAEWLHCNPRLLYSISNHTPRWYRVFAIPKRNGARRTIEAPKPLLKRLQRRILRTILAQFPVSPLATAFTAQRNIRYNAWLHTNQKRILNCDVKNFFPSLKAEAAYPFFRENYEPPVAMMLTRLCTLYGHLPQGASTSPALSNLLLLSLDQELSQWGQARWLQYSRYADDITFSGEIDGELRRGILEKITGTLAARGLELNRPKTTSYHHGNRQLVTGLVVNHQVGVPREKIRRLRTRLHYLEVDLQNNVPVSREEIDHLLGLVNFCRSINNTNPHLPVWRSRLLALADICDN